MDDISREINAVKRRLFDRLYSDLNARQREAVYTVRGPLLVLAGAGSGKTTVLVRRIMHMIRYGDAYASDMLPRGYGAAELEMLRELEALLDGGAGANEIGLGELLRQFAVTPANPAEIMAFTFTNKAASEIKSRLEGVLGSDSQPIWAGTFHSVCVRILRRHIDRLGEGYGRNFTIYDTADTKALIGEVMKDLKIDDKLLPYREAASKISRAKDALIGPERYAQEAGADYRMAQVARIYEQYQRRLVAANSLDFDDLIGCVVRLLQQDPSTLAQYHRQFTYFLVDEYQDTNRAQFALIRLLASGSGNLMVVGDDDQSIYRFRGATIENILSFDRQYSDAKVVKLEQNYRSTKNILDAANGIISNNHGRHEKSLWTDHSPGEPVCVHEALDQFDEAAFIINTIVRLKESEGLRFSDFAVLYRLNALSNNIETVFAKSGMPYRIVGGLRFGERREVKDIMSYLCLIDNPADDQRLRRVINVPRRGIGDTTLNAVQELAYSLNLPLFEIIRGAGGYPQLAKSKSKLEQFAAMIEELRLFASSHTLPELVEYVPRKTGYEQMLTEAGAEELERMDNIHELISNAQNFTERNDEPTLAGFLEEFALVADIDNYNAGEDAIVLMTIHSAKGLEFPVVFIAGMEDGLFPSMQSIDSPSDLEEERRLAYVAVTRAKQRLYVMHAHMRMLYGRTMANPLSRFAGEIPPGLCEAQAKPTSRHDRQPLLSNAKDPNPERFAPGDIVQHPVFGTGVVLSGADMGGDMLYEVEFEQKGRKKLMASYAKLKRG